MRYGAIATIATSPAKSAKKALAKFHRGTPEAKYIASRVNIITIALPMSFCKSIVGTTMSTMIIKKGTRLSKGLLNLSLCIVSHLAMYITAPSFKNSTGWKFIKPSLTHLVAPPLLRAMAGIKTKNIMAKVVQNKGVAIFCHFW